MKKPLPISYFITTFFTIFIGAGAFYGGILLIIDSTGSILQMDGLLKYFEVLPFSDVLFKDYTFSGFALIIVNGIPNIVAFIMLLLKQKTGIILGLICGVLLQLWILIQFIIFPFNILSTSYFIFGVILFLAGYTCFVRYSQRQFSFSIDDYPNILEESKTLVVYFSRMGYTKKVAYEIANAQHAKIYEVKPLEKINGNLGFFWCGRFGMHKWPMKIEEIEIDLSRYDLVIICTPIWVFNVSAPIRAFLDKASGKIKNVNYVFVHYMKSDFKKVAAGMDQILKIKHTLLTNYVARLGKIKRMK